MSLGFSEFADDMVLEILGHLPALDIIRYRRVCRRIYQASKDRSVWVNVFLRAEGPLPPVDIELASAHELERLLVRMEIMYAKWTGSRLMSPVVVGELPNHTYFVGAMPPYVVVGQYGSPTLTWFHRNNLQEPVQKFQLPPGWRIHQQIDPERNTLFIVGTPFGGGNKMIKIVIFQVLVDDTIYKVKEHDVKYQTSTLNGPPPHLFIQSGYVILNEWGAQNQPGILVHLETGKLLACPIYNTHDTADHVNVDDEISHPIYHITPFHLIRVNLNRFVVFMLPSSSQIDNSEHFESIVLQKAHTGSLPRGFTQLHVFSRSPSCLSLVGLLALHGRRQEDDQSVHLRFLSLVLDEYSSACQIREDFFYEVKGDLRSFFLAPCSSSSRSTLGILTVAASPPAHTRSGVRIARTSSAARIYELGVKVTFGREGYEKPSILLTEIDLHHGGSENTTNTVCNFDPYAGQVILEQRARGDRGHRTSQKIIIDYVSP